MQEDRPLTQEMIQHLLDMRAKGRHEEASRLYQAKQEGKEEGIKAGKEEGKISIAKNLIDLNFPLEAISQATGLSIGEIENLK